MKKTLLTSLLCISIATAFSQPISWVPTSQGTAVSATGSYPTKWIIWNSKLYFWGMDSNSTEIWSYDELTPAKKETNLYPGGNARSSGYIPGAMASLNGKLYTAATTTFSSSELYAFNGTPIPTKVSNIWPGGRAGPHFITALNGKIYFGARSPITGGQSDDLYVYDGVNPPSKYNIPGPTVGMNGCSPTQLIVFKGKLCFAGILPSGKSGLFELDPATNIPKHVTAGAPAGDFAGYLGYLTLAGSKLYFIGGSSCCGAEVWSYDGSTLKRETDVGPGLVKGAESGFGYYKGEVYFAGSTGGTNFQLYKLTADGTAVLVYTFNTSGNAGPNSFATYKDNLYFLATTAAGAEIWKYNGTTCSMVADLYAGQTSGALGGFEIFNGHLYFVGSNGTHNGELFRINDPTGIENVKWNGKATIFPNPASTSATISLNLKQAEDLQISLLDISGREVFSTGVRSYAAGENTVALPLNSLAAAQYIYRICGSKGDMLVSGKLIKK